MRRTLLFVLACATFVHAVDRSELLAKVRQSMINQQVIVRNFYSGNEVHYDSSGQLSGQNVSGSWTIHGYVLIKKIDVAENTLAFEGDRVCVRFKQGSSTKVQEPCKSSVRLLLAIAPDESDEAVLQAVNKVFLTSSEDLADVVPDYWKTFFHPSTPTPPEATLNGRTIWATAGASPPMPTLDPDPEYDELAKHKKLEGSVLLSCVVDIDGKCKLARIVKPIGYGLDEKAVEALTHWKFTPGKHGGEPVPVLINVELNFRLY